MTLSVSGTWGISEEFNLYLTGKESKFFIFGFLRSCQEKFANRSRKILEFQYMGLWHVLPFIKLTFSKISASCSDPASLRNKFNLQVPWLLCIISHRYQYQYNASLNKAINHRVNTSHGGSLLYTKII